MTDRDVFHDMHEAAAVFAESTGSAKHAGRLMRAAFLAGAAWHDGLSSQEAALLRAQAGIRTHEGSTPSPEAQTDDFGGAQWEHEQARQALKDAQSAEQVRKTHPEEEQCCDPGADHPVLRCPFPGCSVAAVHTLGYHPDGSEWAAEHDLWDAQRFVAPILSQRGLMPWMVAHNESVKRTDGHDDDPY